MKVGDLRKAIEGLTDADDLHGVALEMDGSRDTLFHIRSAEVVRARDGGAVLMFRAFSEATHEGER